MKTYSKTHSSKVALNSHLDKIKRRGAKYVVQGMTIKYTWDKEIPTSDSKQDLIPASKISNYDTFIQALKIIKKTSDNKTAFENKVKERYSSLLPKYFSDVRRKIFKVSDSEWVKLQNAKNWSEMYKVNWQNVYDKI